MKAKDRSFSRIFKKHIGNPAEHGRMADDLGALKGVFGYIPYDPVTGERGRHKVMNNTLTNLSKSTIIRLLGAGASAWGGGSAWSASDLQIARMRFGNNTASTPDNERKYLYYDIAEANSFDVATLGGLGVGGDMAKSSYGSGFATGGVATIVSKRNAQASDGYAKVEASGATGSTHRYKTYPVKTGRVPSQFTVKVEFMSSGATLETVYFNSAHNWLSAGSKVAVAPYVRAAAGSPATKIVTAPGASQVTYRGTDATSLQWDIDPYLAVQPGASMLFYDYADSTWKLFLDEWNAAAYETMKISFMVGKHNVVNDVVPRSGVNKGVGLNVSDRYSSTVGDSYAVVATRDYRDCDSDLIDDYAVTFAVNMTASDGNGTAGAEQNQELQYTQAWLFNGRDEMFSSIQLSSDNAFSKNSKYAYYVTWQIAAPIN